ncbi:MAG: TetR/AcrR family transcriptional regulator [Salinarimonas sp.]|nr:TetR/AcrR family transcriptional regulator [Salinarimonas sp.]
MSDHAAEREQAAGKKGYHHGNLRAALIAATRELLAARGPQGFTLADAARKAGVSAAAPYRHFADRDSLMLSVAHEGFALFGAQLSEAVEGNCDPQDALAAMGRAYLAFARAEPGYYAAMFAFRHGDDTRPDEKHDAAFQLLISTIASVLNARHLPDDAACPLAFQIWSLSHGVATLDTTGHLDDAGMSAEDILVSGAMALLAGAGRTQG